MWWILIPGAAAVAYKVYEALKDQPESLRDPRTSRKGLTSGDPSGLPSFGVRLERWLKILRGRERDAAGDDGSPSLPSARAGAALPRSRRRFRPSHLTLLTALALVGVIVASRGSDATWLRWTQDVLLGALIGIGTNWVAIKMLFRPLRPVLGVIQGVIPANQHRIAEQIARGISSYLLDEETIRKAVHDSDIVESGLDELVAALQRLVGHEEFQRDVKELLVAYVGAFVEDPAFRQRLLDAIGRIARRAPEKLGGVLGIFSKEIGTWLESMVHQHHEEILAGLQTQVPGLVEDASTALQRWLDDLPARVEERRASIEQAITESIARRASTFDVEGMVKSRLEAFSLEDLETLILSATDEQLVWLQYLGWIIGALAVPLLALLETLVRL